jgi:hypothetical protein
MLLSRLRIGTNRLKCIVLDRRPRGSLSSRSHDVSTFVRSDVAAAIGKGRKESYEVGQ